MFGEILPVSMSQVLDGLSYTTAFSERMRGSGRPDYDLAPERDLWSSPGYLMCDANQMLKQCRIAGRTDIGSTPGATWSGNF